jgi:16S rRNA processing protein RimM
MGERLDEKLQVGVITSPHGLRGEVKVFPTTDDPQRFRQLKQVLLLREAETQALAIAGVKYSGKFVILKFAGLDRIEDVEKLKGQGLWVERQDAVPLAEDEYFAADLLDMAVIGEDDEQLGRIVEVIHTGANDVYAVANEAGRKLLLPAIKDCILAVDVEKRLMRVRLLEGLLEL